MGLYTNFSHSIENWVALDLPVAVATGLRLSQVKAGDEYSGGRLTPDTVESNAARRGGEKGERTAATWKVEDDFVLQAEEEA